MSELFYYRNYGAKNTRPFEPFLAHYLYKYMEKHMPIATAIPIVSAAKSDTAI